MAILRRIFDFYIESSIHVALAVYALIRITCIQLNIFYDESVAYFGFYGTIVGYNFIKYDELARIKKITLSNTFKAIIFISAISFVATVYYFFLLERITQFIALVCLLLTVIYTLPFKPNRSNLRNLAGIKIYIVALAWVFVTVLLPVVNNVYEFDVIILWKSLQRFVLVFVLMLLFEINDMKDDADYLQTIPQKIGVSKTKWLAYLLLFLFFVLEILQRNFSTESLLTTINVVFILFLFTWFSTEKRNKYYTNFWVEAVPIFWLLLLLIF